MSEPIKYQKKPVVIEAMRWGGAASGATPIINWILKNGGTATYFAPGEWNETASAYINIQTLEGNTLASPHDIVIRGVAGEFYACKPDVFAKTYERADAPVGGLHPPKLRDLSTPWHPDDMLVDQDEFENFTKEVAWLYANRPVTITDDMIERGAEAAYEAIRPKIGFPTGFRYAPEPLANDYRLLAHAALEAALGGEA